LALKQGKSVEELLQTMSAAELVHWFALYDLDPWTEDRADLRSAMQCAIIANAHSIHGGFGLEQFLLKFKETELADSEQDQELAGMKWCVALGGKVVSNGNENLNS
jgi:hypothetical protein